MNANKLILVILLLIATLINISITTKSNATMTLWTVTCNYDANGNYTGGSCSSSGNDLCRCPREMVIEED